MEISNNQFSYARMLGTAYEGVQRGMRQMNDSAERIAEGDVSAENIGEQIEGEAMVKANAVSMRSADETVGRFLDELA